MYRISIYIFICLLALFPFQQGFSQTGVGTLNPQGALRIDGAKDNNPVGAPTVAQAANDVMVTTSGQLGVGVVNPVTKVDLRSATNRGIIGVGPNTQTAVAAGAGAIRYFTATGLLHYSDGENWIPLPLSAPPKALVLANKSVAQSISQNSTTQYVTSWLGVTDSGGHFNHGTGIFTAPRDGFYVVSFSVTIDSNTIPNNTRFETIIESNTATDNIQTFKSVNSYPAFQSGTTANRVAGNCSAIFNLKAGNTIRFRIWHNLGGNRAISTINNGTDNSISISEL
ncbi:hypothetical protein J2X31_001343 [Flavobacterium arsenatis]|uniref:C1q domain-containing protein n=1 Tax=Flavobacterium arsenatis TaxID=1484332 RepID=A0ABU1TMZ2_9FLAO|nr:hypothetical protein [Flavobacterium arsenatis]MDR6967336.1 hypothetical protein [Flavobacterium arsenatis]